jgi:hypothetical protein
VSRGACRFDAVVSKWVAGAREFLHFEIGPAGRRARSCCCEWVCELMQTGELASRASKFDRFDRSCSGIFRLFQGGAAFGPIKTRRICVAFRCAPDRDLIGQRSNRRKVSRRVAETQRERKADRWIALVRVSSCQRTDCCAVAGVSARMQPIH